MWLGTGLTSELGPNRGLREGKEPWTQTPCTSRQGQRDTEPVLLLLLPLPGL